MCYSFSNSNTAITSKYRQKHIFSGQIAIKNASRMNVNARPDDTSNRLFHAHCINMDNQAIYAVKHDSGYLYLQVTCHYLLNIRI